MLKLLRHALIGLVSLAVVVAGGVFAASEMRLHQSYDRPLKSLAVASAAPLAARGERLANVVGCIGCHHEAGNELFAQDGVGRLVAPNLSRVARAYSDDELARLLRTGVKRDGTSVIAMPAKALTNLADADIASIIAYLRAMPEQPDAAGATAWGPLGRVALALGKVPFSADAVVPGERPVEPPSAQRDVGAYLVASVCTACHALDEVADDGWGVVAPPLRAMAQAYSPEDFARLLKTGVASGDREAGLMSKIARSDLSHLEPDEIAAIYAYLNQP